MLASRCRLSFDSIIIRRGEEYFQSGHVLSWIRRGMRFAFRVKGSGQIYEASLDFKDCAREKSIDASCNCDFYQGGDLCKHLWAAILKLNSERISGLVPASGILRVRHLALPESSAEEEVDVVAEAAAEGESEAEAEHDYRDEFKDEYKDPEAAGPVQFGREPKTEIRPVTWLDRLDRIQRHVRPSNEAGQTDENTSEPKPGARVIYYSLSNQFHLGPEKSLVIELFCREISRRGELGNMRPFKVSTLDLETHPDRFLEPEDREILVWLLKIGDPAMGQSSVYRGHGYYSAVSRVSVPPTFHSILLPRLVVTGRLFRAGGFPGQWLQDDRHQPWEVEVAIDRQEDFYLIQPHLVRGAETLALSEIRQAFSSGYFVWYQSKTAELGQSTSHDLLGLLSHPEQAGWLLTFLSGQEVRVPKAEASVLVEKLLNDSSVLKVLWPPELQWKVERVDPRVRAVFIPLKQDIDPLDARMLVALHFDYPQVSIPASRSRVGAPRVFVNSETRSLFVRDLEAEAQASAQLTDWIQALRNPDEPFVENREGGILIGRREFSPLVSHLVEAGWEVLAEGKRMSLPKGFDLRVNSGVDWFELEGKVEFEGTTAEFPELLLALKRGDGLVRLGDGTMGMLPLEWMARYAPLMKLGEAGTDSIRFRKIHGVFLDSWLQGAPGVRGDQVFQEFQKKIRGFEGVQRKTAPRGFRGKLRTYQKEGLAWLSFVDEFGLGGILADDMGLGKTIQLLAFLLDRKAQGNVDRPNIVVAPKSLVFNWIEEAARFAPKLKVLDYSGKERSPLLGAIEKSDLVITTFAVIRKDIEFLQKVHFDVAVVDEAQAIKNPKAQASEACKLLNAKVRIAMTGTPIENSIGDLFSIMDFTSPGLLTRSLKGDESAESRERLIRALRPVILRRTKDKVLKELPEKTEQTLLCEMSTEERKRYDDLRDHYRTMLKDKISAEGFGRAKIHVLEALLRLRQAACHPGLLDPRKKGESSSKLDCLLDQLRELVAEGHKALVFSQFTSLLAIVESRFKEEGIAYEYLDGKTENRKERVQHFQSDPDCKVFLISLKAGGMGLNLTEASYVFLLDPWWNPAVESQAIDRAHRIGQSRKVFAYRMIAHGTVEERILELQKNKKELAEAIIAENTGFLRKMTREDLELLLS